ncbi:high-potential iron-sulfur protein [Rheinheimera aquimaris]
MAQGSAGDAWRPCGIFPGKLVSSEGWCAAWAKKPG